jgi:hypothetical protein
MKRILLVFTLIITSNSIYAQEAIDTTAIKKNEIKLNALYMVVGAFEVSYEYLLNEESGVGISVFLPFDDDIKDDVDYLISPYYRFYFGNKYASGFFLEGFGMLSSTRVNEITYFNSEGDITGSESINETNFALGIGLGGKWITNRGLLGEINLGVGRNLFSPSEASDEFVGKIGITIGYRF